MKTGAAPSSPSIAALWTAIDLWLAQSQKKVVEKLPPGASESEILDAENALGIKFPRHIRQSYRIHNGSGSISLVPFASWNLAYPLLPLSGVVNTWKTIQGAVHRGAFSGSDFVNNPNGPIKKTWFHHRWIPIVDDLGGDFYFLDLAPSAGGKRGQIIDFFRESGATNVIAESFLELLARLAHDFAAGKYTYDEKSHAIVLLKKRQR